MNTENQTFNPTQQHRYLMRHYACFIIAVLLLVSSFSRADAADSNSAELVGLVNDTTSLSFTPSEELAVIELSPGKAIQLPAAVVHVPNDETSSSSDKFVLGSIVPLSLLTESHSPFQFTFLAFGEGSSFAATDVQRWSREQLIDNSISTTELNEQSGELEQQQSLLKLQHQSVRKDLETLRDQASVVAGVDGIIDLKLSIEKLRVLLESKKREIERLRQLLARSRNLSDPPEILDQHQELLMQLKEATQTTASADRLHQKKKQQALSTVEQKMSLIKEVQGYDSTTLANDVLNLRAERRKLEAQLGESTLQNPPDF